MTFSEGDDDGDDVGTGDVDRPAPAAARPPTGTGRRRSGCLVPVVVFIICACLGFIVAASVRGDDDGEKVTLEEGEYDGDAYRIEGVVDEQGAQCVQLLRNDELYTGACDTTANEARVGDMSVIFGKAPAGTVSVRMPLTNGDRQSAEVQEKDGFRWYSLTVEHEIDMGGEPTFVNAEGGSN